MDFNKLRKNASKAEGGSPFTGAGKKHLTRKDRKEIQINKKYYFMIRRAVFENPGTTYTQWADKCMQCAVDHGVIKPSDK